jgi:hypothetical protein
MELYANSRGFHAAAFTDFEEAINWLMASTESSLGPKGEAVRRKYFMNARRRAIQRGMSIFLKRLMWHSLKRSV